MSKNTLWFFKYGLVKLYIIFPIVRIFQIPRQLMHNDVFVQGDSSFTARTINPIKKLVKITKL
jgi:hypothetical protein